MRRRVLGLILAATLLAVTLLGAGTYIYVRKLMIERTEERMEDIARLLLSELEPGEEEEQAKRWLEALNAQYDVYRLTLMDAQGQVFFDSDAAAGEMETISSARRSAMCCKPARAARCAIHPRPSGIISMSRCIRRHGAAHLAGLCADPPDAGGQSWAL